jgi:hypothetical protein
MKAVFDKIDGWDLSRDLFEHFLMRLKWICINIVIKHLQNLKTIWVILHLQ